MLRRFWGRLCPHCLNDDAPIEEHRAIRAMDRTGSRLDRLLDAVASPTTDPHPSGNVFRDQVVGATAPRPRRKGEDRG